MAAVSEYAVACDYGIPGVLPGGGPGWYLVAENTRVEAGPFPDRETADAAARWLDDHGRGVNPWPWRSVRSRQGLIVGSRYRGGRMVDPARS